MADLSLAILGLTRTTTSIGLSLKRYMKKGGKHNFKIIGYDYASENAKQAEKMDAIDTAENRPENAVKDVDIVVIGVSYEETENVYRNIRHALRDGVVILDVSPLKQPSLNWSKEYLTSEHHLVGMTPIFNPHYLFATKEDTLEAVEDLFDDSAILLTPSASCAKEAVDLAFNFASILGSKPRFLDPLEHDMLLAQTVQLPRLLGTVLFYDLVTQDMWEDLKWLTNPDFGALTRPLFDFHPDALRDEFYKNRDALGRVLDGYINTLTQFREALQQADDTTIEAVTVKASEKYEDWINSRYRADWDAAARGPEPNTRSSFLQGMLGSALADKLAGTDDDK